MAAASAGHIQPQQQQHQPTQQQQQKMNAAATMNGNMNRNSPQHQTQQQPQIHNLQQQQHLMQQYSLKQQQQHNYNMQQHMHQQQMMQQQQQMHQQQMHQQQMHLKMQQQQQMFQNQSNQDSATHMMPCQNYMTPMPHTQNKFVANNYNNTMPHYQNQFSNNQRSMQQNGILPAGLVNSNTNNQNNSSNNRASCIPPNVVAPSANQNLYPHQNTNNSSMLQQHNHNNNNMISQQPLHFNQTNQQQKQQTLLQNSQKQQIPTHTTGDLKGVGHINARQQLQSMHANTKQHVANHDNNNCNTNCNAHFNANCNTNVASNHFTTIGLNSNGLNSNSNLNTNINNSNNNHNHSMLPGVKANIPPGWRRLTNNNNEIVYISPTGSTLRSPFQIKDYLLSPGTCKCGLPCPLQPEYFFDFNVQVPNTPLTMPTYQNNNEFNSSLSNSSIATESTASATMSSLSSSSSLHASCSLEQQQSALTTSTASSGAFVVPPIDTSSSSTSSSSSLSSATSSLSSSSSLCSATTTTASSNIPSATSPSSLTCLHLKRFLDSQQLHAHPMESFNKDAKRRKITNVETTLENNNANATETETETFTPATTTPATFATTESKSIFTSDSSGSGGQQQSSHNSTFKMLPPSLQEQQQQQQQQEQHHPRQQLSNHHQQQQQQTQYMITNPTYNNNGMMESANKIWPKDDRILPTTAALTQPESASSHMTNGSSENVQWSSNLCNKPQGMCQTKKPIMTTSAADNNNKEQQRHHMDHTSLYKDDLNGYLQQQTTLVHNSMMNLHTGQEESVLETEEGELEEDEEDEQEEEGEEEIDCDEEDDGEEKEDYVGRLEEGEIIKRTNILEDCISNEELEEEIEDENPVEDFNEDEEAEDDDEDEPEAEEDEDDAEEDEEGNDCANPTVASEQTVIDKTSLDILNDPRIINSSNTVNLYQMPNSQNQTLKQHHFSNIQNTVSLNQTPIANKFSFNTLKNPIQISLNQPQTQQNFFKQQQHQSVRTPIKLIPTAQESPVSSSTVGGPRSTPDLPRKTPDNTKKPEQVGAISTSNESPKPCPPSPAGSIESTSSKPLISKAVTSPAPTPITMLHLKPQQHGSLQKPPPQQVRILRTIKNAGQMQQVTQQPHRIVATNTSRATVTTIAGSRGAATTTTTTSSSGQRMNPTAPPIVNQKIQATVQKVSANSTTSIPISQLQLQPLLRSNDNSGNSQIIMTSTGQIIVVPSSNNKPHMQQQQQQVLIASGNATTTTQSHATTNVIIQQQGTQQVDVLNNAGQLTTATLQQNSNGGYIVSQATNTQGTATQLQPTTVILNSGQNLITNNGAKVLTNTGNIIHAASTQPIITTANQLLTTPSNAGQQTVVLNALPNGGYVIQQQPQATQAAAPTQQQFTAALDSQVVQHLVQQPDGRIIITSQSDPKRRPKKRKTSPSPTATTPTNITTQISPNQTATLLQQHVANLQSTPAANQPQVVQLTTAPAVNATTTATYPQQFQLGNGIQGIVVNKAASTATTTQPQQLILQNGQIIQPMNLIGQQLILPSGLVMAPDTTLLQIQNVGSCGPTTNILTTTPQGTMMLRATSPQTNKQFIQSTTTGQQFIVGSNGQLSPISQIYSTPMGLVMPASTQHNPTATATFVQQNATIQVQQPHHQQVSTPQHITLQTLQQHQQNQLNQQQQHVVNNQMGIVLETAASSTTSPNAHLANSRSAAASPPDTTTHSPRSPERPPSHRSGCSDMVQCVSSSEPDGGTVSPLSTDSRQSPSTTVCDKGIVMSTAYQNTNIYKPTEAKIRRVQTSPQYQVVGGNGGTTTATHITGLTNLTLQPQQQQQHPHNTANNPQHHHHTDNGSGSNKPDTHDSPLNSPTTTLMITPPPPRTPTPKHQIQQNSPSLLMDYQHQLQQQQHQQQLKTPLKNGPVRNRSRSVKNLPRIIGGGVKPLEFVDNTPPSPSSSSSPLAASLQRTFSVGELIWGPARGFPAWPGKVVKILDNQPESVWVQWFGGGGRSNTEIMAIHLLQSLSEGLEAHHKAQKDTRKSRKLNSQLEKAIQEAMTELDRISASSTTATTSGSAKQIQQPTSSTQHQSSPSRANKRLLPRTGSYDLIAGLNNNTSSNVISTTTGPPQPRQKPIRIAPAPPGGANNNNNSPTKSSSSSAATQIVNSSSTTSASK